LLTAQQFADLLTVHITTIYKWHHAGYLPPTCGMVTGKPLLWSYPVVVRWLELNCPNKEAFVGFTATCGELPRPQLLASRQIQLDREADL
jgi:hypothetical protein